MNEIFSFTSKNTNIKMCRWEKVEGVESYQLGQNLKYWIVNQLGKVCLTILTFLSRWCEGEG